MVYDTYKSSIMPYYSCGDHDENHIKSRVINPPKRVLQGPRPPPLKVIKDSSCTKSINKNKPNAVIAAAIDHYNSPHHQLIGTRRCNGSDRRRRPLVIHLKSPKLSNSTNGGGGGVSSLKASNIFSPASLFGSTGFMSSSPNNIIACTNSHWHDEFGT
ncbi:hypothetical protein BVC80_1289g142 [Macleaya cordata]|uniref:Uncharacterized protein n=1 Tax=Macleaya cordata TaxID=56857 RepID=A0A200Q9S1_MACCD|nr:hypothetical protein BVC80_1289g142 [Macleaya cordata]